MAHPLHSTPNDFFLTPFSTYIICSQSHLATPKLHPQWKPQRPRSSALQPRPRAPLWPRPLPLLGRVADGLQTAFSSTNAPSCEYDDEGRTGCLLSEKRHGQMATYLYYWCMTTRTRIVHRSVHNMDMYFHTPDLGGEG